MVKISEEKELLLKDLCARLPYGIKCQVDDGAAGFNDGTLIEIDISKECVRFEADYWWVADIDEIKPYLRSIYKLTNEELEELEFRTDSDYVDYCNKHYIDYCNLIPKGLALEAPEGMYK